MNKEKEAAEKKGQIQEFIRKQLVSPEIDKTPPKKPPEKPPKENKKEK